MIFRVGEENWTFWKVLIAEIKGGEKLIKSQVIRASQQIRRAKVEEEKEEETADAQHASRQAVSGQSASLSSSRPPTLIVWKLKIKIVGNY